MEINRIITEQRFNDEFLNQARAFDLTWAGAAEYRETKQRLEESMPSFTVNQSFYIASVLPNARMVAPESTWEQFGRKVRENAPFAMVGGMRMYDVADTEGNPVIDAIMVSQLEDPIGDVDRALEAAAVHVIRQHAFSVQYCDSGTAYGMTDHVNREVFISTTFRGEPRTNLGITRTAVHELSHVMFHSSAAETLRGRDVKEIESESITQLVMACFGLDITDYSMAYIQRWCGDKRELYLDRSSFVLNAAGAMLTKLQPALAFFPATEV